jgi:hypothetical protein
MDARDAEEAAKPAPAKPAMAVPPSLTPEEDEECDRFLAALMKARE